MHPAEPAEKLYTLSPAGSAFVLCLESADETNRLSRSRVEALTAKIESFNGTLPLIITGNERFFSAGADLKEISQLTGASAFAFAKMGQRLMDVVANYPSLTVAAISGYCMGGGLDLALACNLRIAAPNAIFGHRGAALGIMTGWGGTQRLRRLVGRARALQMFLAAEKLHAQEALRLGLIDQIGDDPVTAAREIAQRSMANN